VNPLKGEDTFGAFTISRDQDGARVRSAWSADVVEGRASAENGGGALGLLRAASANPQSAKGRRRLHDHSANDALEILVVELVGDPLARGSILE